MADWWIAPLHTATLFSPLPYLAQRFTLLDVAAAALQVPLPLQIAQAKRWGYAKSSERDECVKRYMMVRVHHSEADSVRGGTAVEATGA